MAAAINRMLGASQMKGHQYVTGAAAPQMDAPEYQPGAAAEVVDRAENIIKSTLSFVKRHPFAIALAALGLTTVCLLSAKQSYSQQ